jgi:hypothetical protein
MALSPSKGHASLTLGALIRSTIRFQNTVGPPPLRMALSPSKGYADSHKSGAIMGAVRAGFNQEGV